MDDDYQDMPFYLEAELHFLHKTFKNGSTIKGVHEYMATKEFKVVSK